MVQSDSLDVFHDDARPFGIVQGSIVKCYGVGVLELGHQERFPRETIAELRVGSNVVVHYFDDDLPAQVELLGQVDSAHASFTQKADGLVPIQESAFHGPSVNTPLRFRFRAFETRAPALSGRET